MEINEETVSEEQVLFNKLRSEEQEFIIKIMRTFQPCELIEDKKIEKMAFAYKVEDEMQNANNERFKEYINEIIDYINKEK